MAGSNRNAMEKKDWSSYLRMGKNGDDGNANYKQVAVANNVYNGMRKAATKYDAHISLSSLDTRTTMHMVVLSGSVWKRSDVSAMLNILSHEQKAAHELISFILWLRHY